LKKAILVNSLMNIQRKKNKFFFVDLHLKLLNEYVKKIMRDRRISFMNIEYLFEYNARFVNSIKRQLIWMKRFHNVQVNIKHSMIDEFNDIMKLTIELRKEMISRETKRISSTNQAKNLFVLDDKTLKVFVDKFNAKWIEIDNSNVIDEKLHCDLTNIYANDAFDLYAKISEIELMFAKRAKMKTKMNVWSMNLRARTKLSTNVLMFINFYLFVSCSCV
jgi:hypothetical protein